MKELREIIFVLVLVAFSSSCDAIRTNDPHHHDTTHTIQTDEDIIPKLATVDERKLFNKYSRDKILSKLEHNKDSIIEWTNEDIQEFKHIDSSIIVLNKLKLAKGSYTYSFEICLMKEIKGNLKLIAKGIVEDTLDYYLTNTRLDTNAYKISEQEYAIGVIGIPTWVHNGLSYYNLGTNLVLFRMVENKIYPIVLLPLEYTHGDRHQENDSTIIVDTEVSNSSKIIISNTKTDKYFDLILKTQSTSVSKENIRPIVTKTKYKWNQGIYIAEEEE